MRQSIGCVASLERCCARRSLQTHIYKEWALNGIHCALSGADVHISRWRSIVYIPVVLVAVPAARDETPFGQSNLSMVTVCRLHSALYGATAPALAPGIAPWEGNAFPAAPSLGTAPGVLVQISRGCSYTDRQIRWERRLGQDTQLVYMCARCIDALARRKQDRVFDLAGEELP